LDTYIKFEQAAKNTMDGILDTVSAAHSILPIIDLLKSHGKLVLLGAIEKPLELPVFPLLMGNSIRLITNFAMIYIYIYIYILCVCVGILFYSFVVIELKRVV
jgi:D-arabinose 1-dehydrogenase-like Zn-dependent alcohol dehydrogenase